MFSIKNISKEFKEGATAAHVEGQFAVNPYKDTSINDVANIYRGLDWKRGYSAYMELRCLLDVREIMISVY